jgi:hypothetical protein
MSLTPLINQPGWAEMFLPIQTLEMGNIQIDEPKIPTGPGIPSYAADRPISSLSYQTSTYSLPCLNIITPFLRVHSWDSSTGRLELEADYESITYLKFGALQEVILSLLAENPFWLIQYGIKTIAELRANFQHILTNNILTIYLHGQNPEKKPMGRVWIWREGVWQKGATVGTFRKGQEIRVGMRLQGVCFLPTQTGKMRCRLQHQTVTIFHKG